MRLSLAGGGVPKSAISSLQRDRRLLFKPYADHVAIVYEGQFAGDEVEGGANGRDVRLEYGKAGSDGAAAWERVSARHRVEPVADVGNQHGGVAIMCGNVLS
jgi:hypothetical protein